MTYKIKINGVTMDFPGNLHISNGRVLVNGRDVTPNTKEIHIAVLGNVDSIDADTCASIAVTGDVKEIKTMSGDVRCRDVLGSVKTMSGDVHSTSIKGGASTMSGDINTA